MNRKTISLLILLSFSVAVLSAHDAVRSAGLMTWEWDNGKDSISDLSENDKHFFGFQSEYIHSHLGYGMDALVSFWDDSMDRSMLDWQGQLFMRYHLFGERTFLDPFAEAGIGHAGTVRISDGDELQMSLYPFVSAGLNLVFSQGFYIGSRWSYRMDEWEIPGTEYPTPELGRFQMSLSVGVSYSSNWSHRDNRDKNHYHYD
ncbi:MULTISPECIES: hypothetical protein [unclassified Oceanispirochaeta]|uniref:hypothetical protein n=1 Tax=unclassified Oceanispirochaeta TaxID=2635722 RepID=UPI0011C067CB|nr:MULTISPECIES: hypothetical protein [unclassified Oceanispirochaeta]MBF9018860.1 hypothetical protein [Oceanispirochaeta sp. M2]NPD75348.1 hypothetical protein [Oceanispirochaeta sp. M1]